MIRYWQKYRFKLGLIVIILLVSVIALTAFANIFLLFAKKNIEQSSFFHNISIGGIFYLPCGKIILKNIKFPDTTVSPPRELISIPKITMHFSIWKLLSERKLYFPELVIDSPRAQYYEFYCFIRDNFMQIIEFFLQLPKQDIKLIVKEARLDVFKNEKDTTFISSDMVFKIKNGRLLSFGSLGLDKEYTGVKRISRTLPVQYNFTGVLKGNGISIEKLELIRENLYSQLWLNFSGQTCKINGFTFINTNFREYEYQKPIFDIAKNLKSFFGNTEPAGRAESLPRANLHILDIDCQFGLDFPLIRIDQLNFAINNNPITIKGNFILTDPIKLDLKVSTYLTPLGELQVENLKKINLAIKGIIKGSLFKGGMGINLDFVKKKIGSPPLQRAEISLESCVMDFAAYPRASLRIADINLFFRTDSNEYRTFFKDFNAELYLKKDRFKYIAFNSQFYDGYLKGISTIDLVRLPPLITSIVRVRNVSANKLAGILVHFSKVYGKLDSLMYFNNYPNLDLEGKMVIHAGYLKNFEFFKWLASFLDLESLKKIDFNRAYSNFSVNPEGASLHEIGLDSKDVRLGGHFKLGHDNLVSSQLTLTLTKGLLQESPKLTPLVKLLKEELDWVNFDFRLSGNLHRMNFQWLQSDFKKRLQKYIPNFIERQIERSVEDFIGSMYAK